jgi:hypothetical protein
MVKARVGFAVLIALGYEFVYQRLKSKLRPANEVVMSYPPTPDNHPQQYTLAPEQLSFFHENGFVVVRNALDHEQVAFLKAASETLGGSVPGPYSRFMNNPWQLQPGFLDFLTWGPSGAIASALMGSDTVRLVLDYSITMDVGAPGAPWHADMMHITDESPEVSLWYSLTNVTLQDGGGIRVSKNSHRLRESTTSKSKCFWRVDKTKEIALTLSEEERKACEEVHRRNAIDFELQAGDLVCLPYPHDV